MVNLWEYPRPLLCFFIKCFTTLSSKEWKLIIDKRPSGANISNAELSRLSNSSNSELIKLRIAWKPRVAGCLCLS